MRSMPSRMHSLPSRQKGLGMIDLILWSVGILAVIGFIVGLSVTFFNSIDQTQAGINLSQLKTNVAQLYRQQGNYTGVNVQSIIDNGLAPDDLKAGTALVHEWNGSINISPTSLADTNDAVIFEYQSVPGEDVCSKFVASQADNFYRIDVGGTPIQNLPAGTAYNVGTLGSACSGTGMKTIRFYASLR